MVEVTEEKYLVFFLGIFYLLNVAFHVNFWQKAVVLWTYDPPERDAKLVNEALRSWKKGIREIQVVVEIACASSPNHLIAVRQAYCSLFDQSLEEDIISSISMPVQKVNSDILWNMKHGSRIPWNHFMIMNKNKS